MTVIKKDDESKEKSISNTDAFELDDDDLEMVTGGVTLSNVDDATAYKGHGVRNPLVKE